MENCWEARPFYSPTPPSLSACLIRRVQKKKKKKKKVCFGCPRNETVLSLASPHDYSPFFSIHSVESSPAPFFFPFSHYHHHHHQLRAFLSILLKLRKLEYRHPSTNSPIFVVINWPFRSYYGIQTPITTAKHTQHILYTHTYIQSYCRCYRYNTTTHNLLSFFSTVTAVKHAQELTSHQPSTKKERKNKKRDKRRQGQRVKSDNSGRIQQTDKRTNKLQLPAISVSPQMLHVIITGDSDSDSASLVVIAVKAYSRHLHGEGKKK